MRSTHNFGQQISFCIFLVGLVLQNCYNPTNLPIPQEKCQTDSTTVPFCEQVEQIQEEEKEKLPVDLSKIHALPIYAAEDMDLTQVVSSKEEQQQLSYVNLPKEQPRYASVGHIGLRGGGKEAESKKPEKRKEIETEVEPLLVKQRRIEEGKERLKKEEEVVSLEEEGQKQLIHGNLLETKQPGYADKGGRKDSDMPSISGYKLLHCLYKGTSSNIYRAIRLSDERPVVIKASVKKTLTEKKIQRFQREFELGQQIHSPHVVRYLEILQDPAYGIALVIEDDQAVELTPLIHPEGFSDLEFLEMAIQIVQGLQAIHAANIIHNDLKPSNIVIQPATKMVKIIDFNQASTLRQEKMQPAILKVHNALRYISPEQTGRVNRSVDYRSDFYALGVTFYQLLCGQLPFTANDALGLIHQHLARQPLQLHQIKPTVALPLSQMVMKLLEKEAENRYQSCEGILYDLNRCLSTLKETNTIPEFALGQQDFSNKLTLSQHVYGRESEIKVLLNAFARVSEGKREVLMVAGQPGVGKTMLIQEIQKPVTLKSGYLLTGKFDQVNKKVAYSAVAQVFDGLVKQLLAEDETRIAHWKSRLLAALGTQAPYIIKIVPSLTLLIGEQPVATTVDISQAKNVFNWVFQEFVNVFANAEHPLVIFLDDLQWADQASLDLMTYLLQQPNISHLLWIGSYRDTEVTSSHPALQAIATLQEAQTTVQTLTLAPLPLESLRQWISDSFHLPLAEISLLAELIQQKTEGNPFFVKMFLQSLYDQGLLTFSQQTRWQWDLAKIRQHPATENVITLMTYQIRQLPTATQRILSIASCLGHRLVLSMLQTAMDCSSEAVSGALQPALNSGILLQANNEISFAHDRVQEAAYSLLPDTEKARTHLMIGRRLLAHFPTEDAGLFDMVAQFNHCRLFVTDAQERLQIALLNLKAGQKAKQATAYVPALNYLYCSKDWVDTNVLWQANYPLAFNLYKELAEVEYLCGHLDTSQVLIAAMQPHLQSTLDKIDIYHLLIMQKIVQGQPQEAITLGHQALQLLGSGLPLDNPKAFIQREMPLLRQKLTGIPLSSLVNAPLVVEPEKQALFKILADLYSPCHQIGSEQLSAATLMAINLSLRYGHVPESCISYVMYGLLLCTQYQEYALGYKFGDLALQLAEKLQAPMQRCRSALYMFVFIFPWSKSIQELPSLFVSFFEACLACSEIEYAGYFGEAQVQILFDQGAPLTKVQQEALSVLQFAQRTKNRSVINSMMRGYQKITANLTGETQNERDFNYNNASDIEFEKDCQKSANRMALGFYNIRKAQTSYLYGYFAQTLQHLELARENFSRMHGFYATAIINWYNSLSCLALYATASPEEQKAYLQQVIQNQQQMQKWQASCPENFAHKFLLVEAELARLQGRYKQAKAYYAQAIDLAGRHGFIQEQALAAERTVQYWLEKGEPICAQGYLNMAFNGYKQWGAKRKLMQLKAKYADLLHAMSPPSLSQLVVNPETTLSGNTLKFLDLSSILKASHAISSEIELPKLLRSMMQIIIENAGGQQGSVLLVEPDGSMVVQAEYANDGTITTLQKTPLANWMHGSLAVVQYVKRLHQSVVVENAMTDEKFKNDPYIRQKQAKSILCIPLLKHTELKAILYVENDLMTHVFTPERVQTVLILTAQMAISLENAERHTLAQQLAEQSVRAQLAEESLRLASHDLQLALGASRAGTWNWELGTNKITWDKTNCALFGLKPEEFGGTYEAVIERIHPEDREWVGEAVKRCIEQDIPYDMEPRVIWPDGSQHLLATQGRVYRDQAGNPIKMAGVCLDMTQRRQLEQERFQALKRAEEEERRRAEEEERHRKEQEEFIDTMCHEIRNPMTGIFGNIDYLKEGIDSLSRIRESLPPDVQSSFTEATQKLEESTHTIKQCVEHQKTIVNDVLDVSKLEAGKLTLAVKPFQPKTVIEEIIPLFATQISAKHLELKLSLPESRITVQGDPDRFKIILINLISNAIKFTERGYIKVSLQAEDVNTTHVALTFSVEDTGVGMTPEEQSRLFQRFSRPLSSQYEGSGLGLVITQKSLKLMGGDIQVESEKGRGSRFTCHLTCQIAPAEATISPEMSLPPTTTQSTPVSGHILVVEDNLMNQKILKRQMEQAGHRCAVANNGQEALDKCEQTQFDLIFMDIEMPVMGGLEATRNIRARGIVTPIVGLSAYTRPEHKQEARQAGMNDYLTKPYEKEKIFTAIQRLLK